LQNKHLKRDR